MEGQVLVRQSGERSRIRRHRATGNYDKQEMEEIRRHEGKRSIQPVR